MRLSIKIEVGRGLLILTPVALFQPPPAARLGPWVFSPTTSRVLLNLPCRGLTNL